MPEEFTAKNDDTADAVREKVVVHASYPLWRKHTLISMARAKELQDQGNDVLLTYCNSKAGTCAANYTGNPVACWICRNRVRSTAESLGLNAIPLETDSAIVDKDQESLLKLSEKKAVVEGTQSGITSTFRTFAEDVKKGSIISRIKRLYYRTSMQLLSSFNEVVEREQPDRVEVFNGRHACSRFPLIAAEKMGLPFNTLEATYRRKPIVFVGHTAHDRKAIQRRIMKQDVNVEVAEEYYARRKQPKSNKFARKHGQGFEPPTGGGFKKKVSVFLSSQDEFASLGKDWVSPFLDYAPIVQQACEQNPEYLFCIRFHPNQADITSDIITPFQDVARLPNTQVYYPTDDANTYKLIEWSDLVITFGSTVTVEACWMNKPVIMLGPSFFDELDVSYNPTSIEEFLEILPQSLSPKDRDNAARFACYHELDSDPMKYVRFDGKTIRSKGFRLHRLWLSQLARTTDDVICNVIKMWTGRNTNKKRDAA